MNVADIVDQKSQRIWFRNIFISRKEPILNVVVNVAVKIVSAIITNAQPLYNGFDSISKVVFLYSDFVVTGLSFALWDVESLNEMEIWLPSAAVVFNIISKSCRLNEGVI